MNNPQLPVARKEGLVIQEMPGEILVYDLATNKAHCLNQTAAFVWESCNGENSVADITRLFGNFSGSPVQEDLVWLALDQLNEKKLLEKEITVKFNQPSRREVIKKIGLATVIALPLVSSLIAPVAASAVTGVCTTPACTCTLTIAPCATVGGCPCTSPTMGMGTGTSNCPNNCAGGCACTVANGSSSCNNICS